MKKLVLFGAEYRDKITGFRGICTGRVEYISGCDQALITAKVGKDGKTMTEWFDVQRLERVGRGQIVLQNDETPGHDEAAPVR